jgi:hypothetical protein
MRPPRPNSALDVIGADKLGNNGFMAGNKCSGSRMPVGERELFGIHPLRSMPVAKNGCGNPRIQGNFGNRATFSGGNREIIEVAVQVGMNIGI